MTGGFFEHSQANKFGHGFRSSLLRDCHATGEFGDGALGFDQVLDHVAVALAQISEAGAGHLSHNQLVDTQTKEKAEVA